MRQRFSGGRSSYRGLPHDDGVAGGGGRDPGLALVAAAKKISFVIFKV